MKEQLMHWQGGDLVVTPNRCYSKKTKAFFFVGLLLLVLAFYLSIRVGDFWQMPLILGGCLTVSATVYDLLAVRKQIYIPKDGSMISVQTIFGKREIWNKQEVEIVGRSANYKQFMAIAHKSNPYGRAYQISPYLTKRKITALFEKEILPIIINQLDAK
ncbi:hypothetical protein IW15_22180 [Chryseobacterium soli]|uniref:Uncharacterized protein n=1 Tax=Chryseobacterium soli TaxID=445961 RepID=A0A085ZZA7_9FLAO|nr:hypothetical protein [Chryseobacterium soli]KFF09771.1 hypothetical protein IW15_22180 [Chryseobacterium soli]